MSAVDNLKLIQANIKEVQSLIQQLNERLVSAKKSLSDAKIEVASCKESMNSKESVVAKEISEIKADILQKQDELTVVKRQLELSEQKSHEEIKTLTEQLSERSAAISSYESEVNEISSLSLDLKQQLDLLLSADNANNEHVAALAASQGGYRNQRKTSIKKLRKKRNSKH